MKFHNSDGVPKKCGADIEPCPLGENVPHFEGTQQEAFIWAGEENRKKAGGTFTSMKKNVSKPKAARKPPYGLGQEWSDVEIPDYPDGTSFAQRWNEHFADLAEWEEKNGREFSYAEVTKADDPGNLIDGFPYPHRERSFQLLEVQPDEDDLPEEITENESLHGKYVYAIETRQGGGNRDCFCDDESNHESGCLAVNNEEMQSHPDYLMDRDDDFDSTYATFYFQVNKTDEELATHRENRRKAMSMNSQKFYQKRVNEKKATPWGAIVADKGSYVQYKPGDLMNTSKELRENKFEKDQTEALISKADNEELSESDIENSPRRMNDHFNVSRAKEALRSLQHSRKEYERNAQLHKEASELPEGSALKEHLLGDRGQGSYTVKEKQGRRNVDVKKTFERGSLLGKDLQTAKESYDFRKEMFRKSEWYKGLEETRDQKKRAISEGVQKYKKLEQDQKESWAHGWTNPDVEQPPVPHDY